MKYNLKRDLNVLRYVILNLIHLKVGSSRRKFSSTGLYLASSVLFMYRADIENIYWYGRGTDQLEWMNSVNNCRDTLVRVCMSEKQL